MRINLLIAGIDPGSNVGFAALDLDGKIIFSGYNKNFGIDNLVSLFNKYDRVVAVGCDKFKIPGLVSQFSAKTGARMISPDHDLRFEEKNLLVKNHVKNNHEFDALSSAFFAYNELSILIRKINKNLLLEQDFNNIDTTKVFDLVIKKRVHIKKAIDASRIIKVKEEKQVFINPEQSVVKPKNLPFENDFLVNKLKEELLAKTILISKLKRSIIKLEKTNDELKKGIKKQEVVKFKEDQILFLNKKLGLLNDSLSSFKKDNLELRNALINSADYVVVVKLKNLLMKNFDVALFRKTNILFVDNPLEFSQELIDKFKNKISFIICKNKPSDKLKNLIFVPFDSDAVKEFDSFVLVKKAFVDRVSSDKDVLRNIIKSYKEERNIEL